MTGKNKGCGQIDCNIIIINILILKQLISTRTDIELWASGYSLLYAIASYVSSYNNYSNYTCKCLLNCHLAAFLYSLFTL